MKKTTKKGQLFSFFARVLPVFAALVILCLNSRTADAATEYPIWVGGTQVTSDNADNILGEINPENGEPTASFEDYTLTLNGVHITPDQYWINDKYTEWNDPLPNTDQGGNYSNTEPPSAVYSLFFGPLRGRRFSSYDKNPDNGLGSRGTILLKGENIIEGYGVGILAGSIGYGGINVKDSGEFYIKGDGTLRINQLYSEKDGVPAAQGALNLLEMPGAINFGSPLGSGPKIYCNGIKCGLYSPYKTRLHSSKLLNIDNTKQSFYTLYGDTTIALQGGLAGFDGRFYYSYDSITLDEKAALLAKSTGAASDPERIISNAAFSDCHAGWQNPLIRFAHNGLGRILGESNEDVGNWVGYGLLSMSEDELNTLQKELDSSMPTLFAPTIIRDIQPDSESYTDPDINVWGFTEEGTVYSVDVEWGAMTFQYETSSWDPETHMTKAGGGWGVYDAASEKRLGSVQDAINRITVTNHSNAAVYAGLTYAAATDAGDYSDISGKFEKSDAYYSEDFKAEFDADTNYISLETADNAETEGEAGTPTVCNVYFKPADLSEDRKTAGITKWTKIGVITVSLQTEVPAVTPDTP